jgi:hypothetical protein
VEGAVHLNWNVQVPPLKVLGEICVSSEPSTCSPPPDTGAKVPISVSPVWSVFTAISIPAATSFEFVTVIVNVVTEFGATTKEPLPLTIETLVSLLEFDPWQLPHPEDVVEVLPYIEPLEVA